VQENAHFWGASRLDERTRKVKTIQQRVITHKVIHKILWLLCLPENTIQRATQGFLAA
jgi:hypothetical protein